MKRNEQDKGLSLGIKDLKQLQESAVASDRQEGGNHYKKLEIEPWDVVDTWTRDQKIGFYRGNVLKYTMRMGTKDESLQEIKKARHYLDKLIEVLECEY